MGYLRAGAICCNQQVIVQLLSIAAAAILVLQGGALTMQIVALQTVKVCHGCQMSTCYLLTQATYV